MIWAIGIYLAFLVVVSVRKGRDVKTQEDFMVAGRGVTATFLVGTLVCTWIGSGSLFGGAGRAFRNGFSALWMSGGAWIGLAIVYWLAPRVRKIAQYTVPDILETRYNATSRVLGTIAIIIAYLTIAGYQFIGGGRLLNILTGIDPVLGQIIIALLVVTYTIVAGMRSIVALDLFNGIMITAGVLLAAPFALEAAGGWEQLTTTLPATHFSVFGSLGAASAIGLFLPTFLLLLGESSIYQKFMSARDGATARRAVIGMILGVILIETVLDSVAIFGAGVYWNDPSFQAADGGISSRASETVILTLGAHGLPWIVGALLLVGGAAIIFSTANTFLMVPSTNLARDIYQRFLKPGASEAQVIFFQRVMIVVLAGVALLITTVFPSILAMALYAYTMVGAAVTPALLAAFLWKRATPAAGAASVAMGIFSTVLFAVWVSTGATFDWGFIQIDQDTAYDYIIYPAFIASVLTLVVVSLLGKPPEESKWKPFAAE
ncbi:MAG: sodium:solute symporter family protein [Acidobacteriota bacterium]|nr:sodium:solute symporter family protein [Acidobacteriota bacterium]MDH3522677.1 sodium:solute symporter family protein [Acidobacteriota bacterium]